MHRSIQALTGEELLTQFVDRVLIESVSIQEFFKIQREHPLDLDAPDGNRTRLLERHAKQRSAGDIGVSVVLFQELEHRQQMRIRLDLVKEDQRVLFLSHFFAGERADLKVKVLHRTNLLKQFRSVLILGEIEFNIVLKELLPDVANDKRLSDLPRSVDDQYLIGVRLQIVFDIRLDFSIQHSVPPQFSAELTREKLHNSICSFHVFRTFQYLLYAIVCTNQYYA